MSSQATCCVFCGRTNPKHRIWCRQCGAEIPFSDLPPDANEDPAVGERCRLYHDLLEDLQQLRDRAAVSDENFGAIHSFYSQQLESIQQQRIAREDALAMHRLVVRARDAAQTHRFQESIDLFQQARAKGPAPYPLNHLIDEVEQKAIEAERVTQIERKIEALIGEANRLQDIGELENAKAV
ncbi:MAG: hypothetical protein ACR2NZ_05815, partial [Rubripirellula sp.]